MATMPKCSGPTAWTRVVNWPVGFCNKKALRFLAERLERGRDIAISFRLKGTIHPLNQKAECGGKRFFLLADPHTTQTRATLEYSDSRGPVGSAVAGQVCSAYISLATELSAPP